MTMFSIANIQTGKKADPFRLVIYGPEGVGKTTFASQAPAPVFVGAEDGSGLLDVARFPEPKTFDDLLSIIGSLYSEDHQFKTVVVDSADWCEKIISESVCAAKNVASIEDIGYGKGYVMVTEHFTKLLGGLSALREARGMHVILIAHANVKTFDDPTADSYDRWTLATSKGVTPILKQWCDALLFLDFDKSIQKTGEGLGQRTIAKSYGDRVMYSQHRAAHDAKNRYHNEGDPERCKLSFETFFNQYKRKIGVTNSEQR